MQDSIFYFLLLKIHNGTGLKYLCKHKGTENSCFSYKGSGLFWKNHLRKRGNDITTVILGKFSSNEELAIEGRRYSALWNIVNSPSWANLKVEEGDGGQSVENIIKAVATRKATILPDGRTIEEKMMEKRSETLRQIQKNGKSLMSNASLKREEKKKNTIIDGKTLTSLISRKGANKLKSQIDPESGKSGTQKRSEKAASTMKTKILSNGLTAIKNGVAKAKCKKYPNNIISQKQIKQWNLLEEDAGKKFSEVLFKFE